MSSSSQKQIQEIIDTTQEPDPEDREFNGRLSGYLYRWRRSSDTCVDLPVCYLFVWLAEVLKSPSVTTTAH
jgi:hypothetical protein